MRSSRCVLCGSVSLWFICSFACGAAAMFACPSATRGPHRSTSCTSCRCRTGRGRCGRLWPASRTMGFTTCRHRRLGARLLSIALPRRRLLALAQHLAGLLGVFAHAIAARPHRGGTASDVVGASCLCRLAGDIHAHGRSGRSTLARMPSIISCEEAIAPRVL